MSQKLRQERSRRKSKEETAVMLALGNVGMKVILTSFRNADICNGCLVFL